MIWIRVAQGLLIASIALCLAVAAVSVFVFDVDRASAADCVTIVFFSAIIGLLSTPWWPVATQRGRPRFESLQGMVMIWFGVAFLIHVTWEFGWVVFRDTIRVSPDSIWAYPWWAYIDGGDLRYASGSAVVIAIETVTVANGVLGLSALWLRHRSGGRSSLSTLILMATAVIHIYGTTLYLATEALDGYPNVRISSFIDFALKFWLLNGIWLVMPWAVLYWGKRTLYEQLAAPDPLAGRGVQQK
jgi:hypothetical protein